MAPTTSSTRGLSLRLLPVRPATIAGYDHKSLIERQAGGYVPSSRGAFDLLQQRVGRPSECRVAAQPIHEDVDVYVAFCVHHSPITLATNSSKSSGHLVILKAPKYLSAIGPKGSMTIFLPSAFTLTWLPSFNWALSRNAFGIITLPFLSSLTVCTSSHFMAAFPPI